MAWSNERVRPNQLCKNCESFWTSAKCLQEEKDDLFRLITETGFKDTHLYQLGSFRKSISYLELHRGLLYPSEADLHLGNSQNCHSCALIHSYYDSDTTQATHSRRSPRLITAEYPYGTIVGSIVLEASADLRHESFRMVLFCCLSAPADVDNPEHDWFRVRSPNLVLSHDNDITGLPLIPDDSSVWSTFTGSDDCCDLIQKWLRQCQASCPSQCSANWSAVLLDTLPNTSQISHVHGKARMPTRLLDLTGHVDNAKIRLVKTADLESAVEYLTLSYTWGGVEPFMLTTANCKDCLKGLLISQLPLVCQQAIGVTRKLGFRYLWIDAICIVQDDKKDWLYESARMDSVFAGSTLTLAASSTRTCNDQLLRKRHPLAVFQLSLHSFGLCYRLVPAICSAAAYPPPPMVYGPRSRGLDSRGWVYQERALSARTIHFTATRLHWECRSRQCREAEHPMNQGLCKLFDQGSAKQLVGHLIESVPKDVTSAGVHGYQIGQESDPRLLWARICSNYGSTALSHWTDRQQAFAGLQRFLESHLRVTIKHGFCVNYGLIGLLWYALYPNQTIRVPNIPTWSYMCLRPRTARAYNISLGHLLAARHSLPQSMRPETVPEAAEVAYLKKASTRDLIVLELTLPLLPLCRLLEDCIKKSASEWVPATMNETCIESVHCLSEAGYTLFEDFSRASYMQELCCGILYQGHTDVKSTICYCLLIRQITPGGLEYERVGVAEVEFAPSKEPDWPKTDIRLV